MLVAATIVSSLVAVSVVWDCLRGKA